MASCHQRKHIQSDSKPAKDSTATFTTIQPQDQNPAITPSPIRSRGEAITAAIQFLQKAKWELDFVYLYSYLQGSNHWPTLPAQLENDRIADSLRAAGTEQARVILNQMKLFERLRNPAFVLDRSSLQSGLEEDAITVPALYCDHYPLDSATYFPKLRNEIQAGDYRLTHAFLATLWLREHLCFDQGQLQALHLKLVQGCHEIIARLPSWMDLNIEAAALLVASGETIPQQWIDGIVQAQQADGGWLEFPQKKTSSTHPTILALWLLSSHH